MSTSASPLLVCTKWFNAKAASVSTSSSASKSAAPKDSPRSSKTRHDTITVFICMVREEMEKKQVVSIGNQGMGKWESSSSKIYKHTMVIIKNHSCLEHGCDILLFIIMHMKSMEMIHPWKCTKYCTKAPVRQSKRWKTGLLLQYFSWNCNSKFKPQVSVPMILYTHVIFSKWI